MTGSATTDHSAIAELAAAHNLRVDPTQIRVVDAGLDYRVAFAVDEDRSEWVLRMPRRPDVSDNIGEEARILDVVRGQLTVEVPDWQIRSRDLIAYPLLPGRPGLTLTEQGEPEWHFDPENPHYARELGRLIAQLHGIDPAAAGAAGVPAHTAGELRDEWGRRLDRVCAAFTVNAELSATWNSWVADDELWPEFTTVTHGELYPAHLLLDPDGTVRSVLDWTTAKIGDPAVDFSYHYMLSSSETFRTTVDTYAGITGREPRRLEDRCAAILAAGPLTYADYALITGDPEHEATAAAQLNPRK